MTVIVMLILAGISLNAIIGDNGIVTNAQNANVLQSCAVIQEYLEEQYVKQFESADEEYKNKIDYIIHGNNNVLYKSPLGYNYVWNNKGQMRYLIDKSKLPKDIMNQIKNGNASTYVDFINFSDCYGVTNNLEVYYCKGSDEYIGIKVDNQTVDFDKVEFSASSSISKVLKRDETTLKNLIQTDELVIDGKEIAHQEIEDILSKLAYFTSLQKITIKNCTVSSLNSLKNVSNINYLYLDNVTVNDYTGIEDCTKLNKLYLYRMDDIELNHLFTSMSSVDYSNLQYLGIYAADNSDINFYKTFSDFNIVNLLSKNTKSQIEYLYLNSLMLTNVDLLDYTGLIKLDIGSLKNLATLSGMSVLNALEFLNLTDCDNVTSIEAFSAESSLQNFRSWRSWKIANLDFLKNCFKLSSIKNGNNFSDNCKALKDISALENKLDLKICNLEYNAGLVDLSSLVTCTSLKELYLEGCNETNENQIKALAGIINNCIKYSIPNGFALAIVGDGTSRIDIKNESTRLDSLDSIKNLKSLVSLSFQNVSWIDAEGKVLDYADEDDKALINGKLNEVLKTLTSIESLKFYEEPGLMKIDFIPYMPNLKGLDLRGTSVTDLSLLEENHENLTQLIIDNEGIDLTKIQGVISDISVKKISYAYSTAMVKNFIISSKTNNNLVNQLSKCTNITALSVSGDFYSGCRGVKGQIDLSKCTKLKKFLTVDDACAFGFKLPSGIKSIEMYGSKIVDGTYDVSAVCALDYLYLDDVIYTNVFHLFQEGCTVKKFHIRYPRDIILDFSHLDMSLTEDIAIREYVSGRIEEVRGLTNLLSLKTFEMSSLTAKKINIIDTAPLLTTIDVSNNKLESLEFLKNCTSLTGLKASNNQILDLIYLKDLTNLKSLVLTNNKLSATSTYLDEDNKPIFYNNLQILVDLHAYKLSYVILSGNRFSEEDYDSIGIKDLKWNNGTAW